MSSVEQVRELLLSRLSGAFETGGLTMTVHALDIVENERTFTAVLLVEVQGERWRVRIPSDKADMHVFDGRPSAELVTGIADMLRIQLVEWWFTKNGERRSARMGERVA
ncbi:hypothetical protein HMPREF1486_02421 [Streptomyces sp. HPH0547]|uniref:Uncharacterized protein n=1 Tax=Streptomyces albus TaxID=1888 RepID=A0A8H1L6R0_9ACTN|nr:hypothetical protein HMPREF1486_02421 [Streptomyces sp. HPH0547]KPC73508.1 hypothetical protein ADL27_51055 [Streptomyces sp. NRRL F-6602]TGG77235.1 hypothetical protein D8771_27365 [Streptomyces albus]